LVGFEHGDIHRPYVLGGIWNGKDQPPESVNDTVHEGKVRLRTIQTRTGHKMQFVEEAKGAVKAGATLKTVLGHIIQMNDTDKYLEIKTAGGHQVLLDDKNKKIEIKSTGNLSMVMDDGAKQIQLKSGGGTITMKQTTGEINIKAGSKLTLDAATIEISSKGPLPVKGLPIKLN
jgi:uncharacterized protein involved in type VI secretion and phage assembly